MTNQDLIDRSSPSTLLPDPEEPIGTNASLDDAGPSATSPGVPWTPPPLQVPENLELIQLGNVNIADVAGELKATPTAFPIWLPIGDIKPGYRTTHIDVQLNDRQAEAACYLKDALDQAGERLAPPQGEEVGRRVQSSVDVIRWLLEQIADGIDRLSTNAIADRPTEPRVARSSPTASIQR